MGDRRTARRMPQQDKQLSYAKDRRNNYGQNDKSSRTSIRLRKRLVNRANRHHDQQVLNGVASIDDAEVIEQKLLATRRKRWRKSPDLALGAHVKGTLVARQARTPDQQRIDASLLRLRRYWRSRQR
jgi:hypothetical protein